MADEDNSELEASEGGESGAGEGAGSESSEGSGESEEKKESEEEDDDEPKDKAGYSKEYKPKTIYQKEYENGHEIEPEEEEGPERKVTIYQHIWGKKDANALQIVDPKKPLAKGKYGEVKGELDVFHVEASANSELSWDVNKKEANLTVIDAKVDASVWHGSVDGKFKLGKWIKSLFSDDEPAPPAVPPGIPGMPGIPALMAARVGDLTTHGSPLSPGIGSTNVIIGNMPAWRTTLDFHACPIVKGVVPDVGGMVLMGSPTVFINNMMACRIMDFVVEIPGGPNPIAMGCPTVFIGGGGAGGAGGGAAGGGGDKAGSEEKKDDNDLDLEGKAEGDLDSVSLDANVGIVANKDKVTIGIKGSAMAAVAKGSIEGGISIPIPWTSHSITIGGGASGYAGAIGGEGHAEAGWSKEKGYTVSYGLKAALGVGGGLDFSLGFK